MSVFESVVRGEKLEEAKKLVQDVVNNNNNERSEEQQLIELGILLMNHFFPFTKFFLRLLNI